jgi:hypothetical protein
MGDFQATITLLVIFVGGWVIEQVSTVLRKMVL